MQQRGDLLLTQPLAPARQRRAIKRQFVPEHHFPAEVLEIRVLTHRSHSASSERLCVCLRMNSPATSRVGNGGCPGPTPHTERNVPPENPTRSLPPAAPADGED